MDRWIRRIHQVKGVLILTSRELLSERVPRVYEESSDALDLATDELQRILEEIDQYLTRGGAKS